MNDSSSSQSTFATINDDVFNLFSSLFSGYKTVTSFTDQEIEETQIAISIESMDNLHHGQYNDYEINVVIAGQTYIENDPYCEQINALTGFIGGKLETLRIDDINNYITNAVGFVPDSVTINSDDGYSRQVRFQAKLYVNDL